MNAPNPHALDPTQKPGQTIGFGTITTFVIAALFFFSLFMIEFVPSKMLQVPGQVAEVLSFFWPADMAFLHYQQSAGYIRQYS
ncbi:MAG: hypothetical protein AAF446_06110 [Pseudomonadota bacterium]